MKDIWCFPHNIAKAKYHYTKAGGQKDHKIQFGARQQQEV